MVLPNKVGPRLLHIEKSMEESDCHYFNSKNNVIVA